MKQVVDAVVYMHDSGVCVVCAGCGVCSVCVSVCMCVFIQAYHSST